MSRQRKSQPARGNKSVTNLKYKIKLKIIFAKELGQKKYWVT